MNRFLSWLRGSSKPAAAKRQLRWSRPEVSERFERLEEGGLDLRGRSDLVNGLPYPDWVAVQAWVEEHVPAEKEALQEIWADVAIGWFQHLAEHLGADYQVLQSPNLLLLHSLGDRRADLLLTHGERTCAAARQLLGRCAEHGGYGPIGMIHLADRDTYIRYIDYYASPGEQPESGGCFLQRGYGHLVVFGGNLDWLERAVAHELSHVMLQRFRHPRWLGEGLAMAIETEISGKSLHHYDRELVGKHEAHWTEETIQEFWAGIWPGGPEEAFGLSYGLSEMLFQRLVRRFGYDDERLLAFIEEADRDDAGAGAMRESLGTDLGELVADILGPGRWAPDQDTLERLGEEWMAEQGSVELRDLEGAASIFVLEDRVYLNPLGRLATGEWVDVPPHETVEWSQLAEQVLELVAVDRSSEPPRASSVGLSPHVEKAGLRTWRSFAERAAHLEVYCYPEELVVAGFLWDGNLFSPDEERSRSVARDGSAFELQQALELVIRTEEGGADPRPETGCAEP